MKIIFALTLLIAVGAQSNNSDEDDNNSAPDDNMSSENDSDMSDEDQRGSSGGRNMNRNNGTVSSDRRMSRSGSFDVRKMMEDLTNVCVNIKIPKEVMDSSKQCLKEEAMKSSILDNMLEGKFPEKEELANLFESVEMCKFKKGGINDIENDYTIENIMKLSVFDKWTGNRQTKEELKEKMATCLDEAQGSGFEKVISHYKCITEYYVSKCREYDEDPGLILRYLIKILTLREESKCASVKISEEDTLITDECIEVGKESFRSSSEYANTPLIKNIPEQFSKLANLLTRFVMNFMVEGVLACAGNKTGLYNPDTKLPNITAYAERVKQYEGWDDIQQERDDVYRAIIDCGREYDMEVENDSESEKLKDLFEDSDDFDACFTPKFAKICGYNNELSVVFDQLMNAETMSKLFEAFKEVGGSEAEDVIALLKGTLKKFKEQ